MAAELSQLSWPGYNITDSYIEEEAGLYFADLEAQLNIFEFSSSSISIDYSSDVFSALPLSSSSVFTDESSGFLLSGSNTPERDLPGLEEDDFSIYDQLMVDLWMVNESNISSPQLHVEEDVGSQNLSSMSSSESSSSTEVPLSEPSLVLPVESMEVGNQLAIYHLLKAYGEAIDLAQKELTDEIIRRLKDKACPTGVAIERLAYYFFQSMDRQVADYLRVESSKNYESAFKAFYQIFPYGRFAHFAANSVIVEAVPADAEVVHIVDFDIANGIQWPPLIEALAGKGHRLLKLTSIKWNEEDCSSVSSLQSFEETRKLLYEYARGFGLRLKMERMDMEGLVMEMKKIKKRGGESEFLAFNCMVGLFHMEGIGRSITRVIEFLKVAKYCINHPAKNRGIITFGDGTNVFNGVKDSTGFGSYFEERLVQCQALLESIERHFPQQLSEARIAMECLFVVPSVSSLAGSHNSDIDAIRRGSDLAEMGFQAWRMNRSHLMEAKELVREGESLYWVRSEGENENHMALGYMGIPLVRVSSWM